MIKPGTFLPLHRSRLSYLKRHVAITISIHKCTNISADSTHVDTLHSFLVLVVASHTSNILMLASWCAPRQQCYLCLFHVMLLGHYTKFLANINKSVDGPVNILL